MKQKKKGGATKEGHSSVFFRFHAVNIGNMSKKDGSPLFLPCTPKGIIHLLKSTGK